MERIQKFCHEQACNTLKYLIQHFYEILNQFLYLLVRLLLIHFDGRHQQQL